MILKSCKVKHVFVECESLWEWLLGKLMRLFDQRFGIVCDVYTVIWLRETSVRCRIKNLNMI